MIFLTTRNKFTGKERDDEYGVNWDYFGARYYDAQIERWMVRDPQRNAIVPKDLLNSPDFLVSPYVYTLNNPTRFFDPNGLDTRGVNITYLVGGSVAGSLGATIVTDTKGNAGLLVHFGAGGLAGAVSGLSGGIQKTGANTIYDLTGLSFNVGVGLGSGLLGVAEFNSALDLSYSGRTTSVGAGAGAGAYITVEESILVEKLDFQNATEVIEHVAKGGKISVEEGKLFLIDDKGNKVDSGITLTTGFEKGTTGEKVIKGVKRLLHGEDNEDKNDDDNE